MRAPLRLPEKNVEILWVGTDSLKTGIENFEFFDALEASGNEQAGEVESAS